MHVRPSALQTALVSGGIVVARAGLAHAAEPPASPLTLTVDVDLGGDARLLGLADGGTLVHAPITAPVDVSGIAVDVGGDATSSGAALQHRRIDAGRQVDVGLVGAVHVEVEVVVRRRRAVSSSPSRSASWATRPADQATRPQHRRPGRPRRPPVTRASMSAPITAPVHVSSVAGGRSLGDAVVTSPGATTGSGSPSGRRVTTRPSSRFRSLRRSRCPGSRSGSSAVTPLSTTCRGPPRRASLAPARTLSRQRAGDSAGRRVGGRARRAGDAAVEGASAGSSTSRSRVGQGRASDRRPGSSPAVVPAGRPSGSPSASAVAATLGVAAGRRPGTVPGSTSFRPARQARTGRCPAAARSARAAARWGRCRPSPAAGRRSRPRRPGHRCWIGLLGVEQAGAAVAASRRDRLRWLPPPACRPAQRRDEVSPWLGGLAAVALLRRRPDPASGRDVDRPAVTAAEALVMPAWRRRHRAR